MPLPSGRAPLVLLLLVAGLLAGPVAPASAHEADPRLVTVLDDVAPALPDRVVVQVQAGLASQLVARNPTAVPLEVLGTDGRPFLRLSSAGVQADVGAEEFFTTSNPSGAAPSGAGDAAPRWVTISSGDSWGWYDHRLHPVELRAPQDERRAAELAGFSVPLRYGGRDVTARGRVVFRPLLGSLLVTADPAPEGLRVQALPGRLPGLFLARTGPAAVLVLGRDGEPFLRLTDAGVEVNESSRTHVEDRQARGQVAGPPSPTPAFRLVAPGAASYTWLDARLRYPADLPPEEVLRADGPTVVRDWRVPVQLDGGPAALTGQVTWVPEDDAAVLVGGSPAVEEGSPTLLLAVVGAGTLLALGTGVLLVRRAQRRTSSAVPCDRDQTSRTSGRETGGRRRSRG